MCQVGAQEWASGGWSGERILQHYYPSARVAPLPTGP
jgi:peptidoglycan hydrolase-like amidase